MVTRIFSHVGVFLLRALSYVPFPVLYFLSSLLYYPIYYLVGYRRKVVRGNLVNSFPGKDIKEIIRIEKEFYRHFTDVIFETIKLNSISKKEVLKRFRPINFEAMYKFYDEGRNVMSCTSHYGNWEMLGVMITIVNPSKSEMIYKPLNNPVFDKWFKKWRTRFGGDYISMRQTLRVVEANKGKPFLMCFASDQSPVKEDSKYFVDFLNQPTPILMGIEKIAKRTGSPVFYLKTSKVKRGYYTVECMPVCLEPAKAAPNEITDRHVKILEEMIVANPAYWLWSHKRWKHKPQNV